MRVIVGCVFCWLGVAGASAAEPFEFPAVNGWEKLANRPLPGGGSISSYETSDEAWVTIEIYTRDRGEVADGHDTEAVLREMAGAKASLLRATKEVLKRPINEQKVGPATIGENGPKAAHARFVVALKTVDVVSDIYILARKNHFVKTRVSVPADKADAGRKAVEALFAELRPVLEK